ncbi:MAG: hypothetical protein M8354_09700, partial [Halalkalicoccus sp.]|nr:hypothetical protein [Halalkalicoccus sp.]
YLEFDDDYQTGNSISASYIHTWNEGSVTGISVSYPFGISVSASSDTQQEDLQTDLQGDNLLVDTSDI